MLVWELVDGEDLDALFARQSRHGSQKWCPKVKYVLMWSRQLFSALACLHSVDLIHRDVKPANVMISSDGKTLKLIDFGLCRQALPPDCHSVY